MYSADLRNQLFSAALPLKPLSTWAGGACTVTVAVPCAPALAGLTVGSVGVTLSLPDGHTVSAAATQVAGTPLWASTFASDNFATPGHVAQGLMITVAGTDEQGEVRTWIVAKGDVDVLDGDASPTPGEAYYAVKLREEAPENPVEGDAYVQNGALSIYHDGAWVTIGSGGVVIDDSIDAESPNPVRNSAIAAALAQKLDGAAAYPAWVEGNVYTVDDVVSHNGRIWKSLATNFDEPGTDPTKWEEVLVGDLLEGKQDALSASQLAAVNSGVTAEKVTTWDGYAAQIAQKANASDLPYALVTRTPENGGVTLLDRAGNRVVVTGDTTLTLPPAVPGYMRDLIVRLDLTALATAPEVTFAASTGETVTFETEDGAMPELAAEVVNLVSFTETAQGVFAVAHKVMQEVE